MRPAVAAPGAGAVVGLGEEIKGLFRLLGWVDEGCMGWVVRRWFGEWVDEGCIGVIVGGVVSASLSNKTHSPLWRWP